MLSQPGAPLDPAAALCDELGHHAGPTRLVAGAEAGPVVAVEILVKQDKVAPARIDLKLFDGAKDRAAPILSA